MFEGERQLSLGGARQRSVLAILLLSLGETVSSDRLIDELWGERPPADAQTALQQHVSRLRKALEPNDVLITRAPGYALDVEGEQLDLERFRRLHDRGRCELDDGKPDDVAGTLRAALALWHGPPLADLQNEHFARDSAAALDDERIAALGRGSAGCVRRRTRRVRRLGARPLRPRALARRDGCAWGHPAPDRLRRRDPRLVVMAGTDWRTAVEVTGPVLRLRTFGGDDKRRHYVAVDDGTSDAIRAWRVSRARYEGLRQGEVITARMTRNLSCVRWIVRPGDDAAT